MGQKRKAVVAGHLCVDLTPIFPEECRGELAKIMLPGKLTNVRGIHVYAGGVVVNTGITMSKLGVDVKLMGKLGKDAFGRMAAEIIHQYGLDQDLIWDGNTDTSYTIALAVPGQDRTFLHSPGANDTFRYEDLNMEEIGKADLFHFGYPPLMKNMFINDGEELVKIFRHVYEAGVITSLDMAGVDPLAPAGKADWEKILEHVMPYTDIFVPSAEELLYMLDKKKLEQLSEKAGGRDLTEILNVDYDVKPLGDILIEMGAKIVLIKCGAAGIYYRTAEKRKIQAVEEKLGLSLKGWEQQEGFEKSYIPERVASGTGAGDAAIAGFLTGFLKGASLNECVQYAAAEGACCVEAYDALGGIRTLEEIREKIEKGWKKQNI